MKGPLNTFLNVLLFKSLRHKKKTHNSAPILQVACTKQKHTWLRSHVHRGSYAAGSCWYSYTPFDFTGSRSIINILKRRRGLGIPHTTSIRLLNLSNNLSCFSGLLEGKMLSHKILGRPKVGRNAILNFFTK